MLSRLNKSTVFFSVFLALGFLSEGIYRIFVFVRTPSESGIFEIYAIGGSSVLGMPYPMEISFPSLAAKMFQEQAAGRKIVVRNLARLGDSMYPESLRLRRALKYRDSRQPGVVLIYAGHNEKFSAPARFQTAFTVLRNLKEGLFYHSLLLSDALCFLERRLEMRGIRDMRAYEFYMRRAIEESRNAGAAPILATVAGNLTGLEPQVRLDPGLSQDAAASLVGEGLALEDRSEYRRAIAYYGHLRERAPSLAPLIFYRIAQCHRFLREYETAQKYYWRAVETEAPAGYGRTTAGQNALIKALAGEYRLPLVDAVRLFADHSPHGLIGNELFVDINHPNIEGTLLLAKGFADAIAALTGQPIKNPLKTPKQAYALARDDKKRPAHDYMWSGNWHTAYAYSQPSAPASLGFAERSYRRALVLMPNHYWAWAGLGLVEAAKTRAPSLRAREGAWIIDLLFYPKNCVSLETGRRIVEGFRGMAIAPEILKNITRLSVPGEQSPFCR